MMYKRNILISVFFIIVQDCKPEWVEIPQFSSDKKIYRGPFVKFEEKEQVLFTGSPLVHGLIDPNGTAMIYGTNKLNVNKHPGISKAWMAKPTSESSIDSPEFGVTKESVYVYAASTLPTPQNVENLSADDESASVTVEDDNEESVKNEANKAEASPEESETEEDDSNRSFLYYIPVSLFKKVHATLKSQPSTMKGKMQFLKNFEKALLAEIQKRLAPVVAPIRKKRESRGDHYDDHEDSVGFPSLEGALMAISFLTFAVYLVQLVMMLFRNLGTQPTPSTGTATVLFNRNKRSVDEFTEHTARILGYIDNYAKARPFDN